MIKLSTVVVMSDELSVGGDGLSVMCWLAKVAKCWMYRPSADADRLSAYVDKLSELYWNLLVWPSNLIDCLKSRMECP